MHTQHLLSSTSLTLPVPVTIYDFRQFIVWREEPPVPPAIKPRKVPFDPKTGRWLDDYHDNPAVWMWHAEAKAIAASYPSENRMWNGRKLIDCAVGFVFTLNDPYFFLDLDDCRDPVTGEHTDEAKAILSAFPGAPREVSISGTGFHITGRCDKSKLQDRRNKFGSPMRPKPTWLEFYTRAQFMALGSGFQGDFNLDWTNVLAPWIPVKEAAGEVDLEAGPDPRYTGPTNDDELIARMLNSGPSSNAAFGKRPHPKYLWEGDAAVLCQFYPSSTNDTYDRSSTDAALMWYFSYWTGKDAARMDRLFRRSGLMRDKYRDRADYRESTIRNAIASNPKIYDKPASIAPNSGMGTDRYLARDQQDEYFAGCVYIRDSERILVPDGSLLKSTQFRDHFGGKEFQVDWQAPKMTVFDAYQAFTQNRIAPFPKVHGSIFRPALEFGDIVTIGEKQFVNVFKPPVIRTVKGDPSPFLNHIAKMFPNERDQQILLSWMARAIRPDHRGQKIMWSPVIQGTEGSGKTPIMIVLEYGIGEQYYHVPNAQDLMNKFNSYIDGKLIIAVDEVQTDSKRELLETLKPLITNPRAEVQNKGADKRMADNATNWIFFTNFKNAIPVTVNSRRYAVMFSKLQHKDDLIAAGMGPDSPYFKTLFGWLEGDGCAIVVNYLMNDFVIPADLAEAMTAPKTSSHDEAILESDGPIKSAIREAIDEGRPGFRGGYISSAAANKLLKEMEIKKVSPPTLTRIIEAMGYRKIDRAPVAIFIPFEDNKKPTIYSQNKISVDWFEQYLTAQGYPRSAIQAPKVSPPSLSVVKG